MMPVFLEHMIHCGESTVHSQMTGACDVPVDMEAV